MRQFLAILATTLLVQSASAQSLWRNFFTTNRDPIVEVVAGSNATVQATTVGSNLRRFTVNSTATGGGLAQTNISYEAVTNAPWQFGDSDLTNWSTLNTNVLSTLGQTNISYVAVTNAPWQTGSANLTNFSMLSTNTFVNKAGDTVSGPILTTSSTSNSPSETELVTAQWVRGLFNAGADYYNTTNIDTGATNIGSGSPVYKFQSTIPISDSRSYTTSDFLTNNGYLGSVITTNKFSQISGAALIDSYMGFTGGVGGPTLMVHPEIYYSYDKTNWYGDFAGGSEAISYGTTNLYQWAISIPTVTTTNASGFYIQRRFKVDSVTGVGVRTLNVLIGTNLLSGVSSAGHLTMEAPNADAGNAFLANNQVFTGSNYFTQPLTLSIATNTPEAGQVLTATSVGSAKWLGTDSIISSFAKIESNAFWESGENVIVKDNFRGANFNALLGSANSQGGVIALAGTPSGAPISGWLRIGAYPTNTGSYAAFRTVSTGLTWASNYIVEAQISISGNELVELSIGLINTPATLLTTDRVQWLANTNWSQNWIAACTANSSSTYYTSSLPVTLNQIVRLGISASTNSANFYTNGVFEASINSNIPGGRTVQNTARTFSLSSGGSSTIQYMYLDYFWFIFN